MTDLVQFVADATRTESKIDTVKFNGHVLAGTVEALIALGNILDIIKKSVFYNREVDTEKVLELTEFARASLFKLDLIGQGEPDQDFDIDPRVFHGIVGMNTEGTELLEAMVKSLQNEQPLDTVNVMEEMGDTLWYMAILCDALNIPFEEVFTKVIAKLKARFPDKYSDDNANNRDLDTERDILES